MFYGVFTDVSVLVSKNSAVSQLHHQNHQRQAGGDDVGDDDGPSLHQHAVDQPQRHACGEQAVHAQ